MSKSRERKQREAEQHQDRSRAGSDDRPENKQAASDVHPRVFEYLTRVGWQPWSGLEHFGRHVERRHGDAGIRVMKEMDTRADVKLRGQRATEIYRLRNATLALALDTALFYFSEFYQKYLTWWVKERLTPPGTLLDIGCDCGLLTCFYAQLYPEAQIWGVDINPLAIQRATELKRRLELSNVTFERVDAGEIASRFGTQQFDLVTAANVQHEVCEVPEGGQAWSLEEVDLEHGAEGLHRMLDGVRRILRPESGRYVCCDRISDLPLMATVIRAMNRAGLCANWDASFILESQENDERKTFPVIVAQQTAEHQQQTLDEILAFDAYPEYKAKSDKLVLEHSAAELMFKAFTDKKRLLGIELEYKNGSGTSRTELWQAGSILIAYHHTTCWYRRLSINSAVTTNELLGQLFQSALGQEKNGKIRVAYGAADYRPCRIELLPGGEIRAIPLDDH